MPAPRKVSNAQFEELLAWMELHPQQAKNSQLGCAKSKAASNNLWKQLASRLNASGSGTTKTMKEWRQYWNDQKCKVRRKGSLRIQHGRGTDGGPPTGNILTPIEERLLSLVGVQTDVCVDSVRHEVDMGLDELEAERPVVAERLDSLPLQMSPPKVLTPQPSSQGHPLKRKHTGSMETPKEKSQCMGPPQWALDLEERRLELAAERLEENRRFHKQILDQQEKFHTELLSVLKKLVCARHQDSDES